MAEKLSALEEQEAQKAAQKQEKKAAREEKARQKYLKQQEIDQRKLEKYVERYRKKYERQKAREAEKARKEAARKAKHTDPVTTVIDGVEYTDKPIINTDGTDPGSLPEVRPSGHPEQRRIGKPTLDEQTAEPASSPDEGTEQPGS